MNERFSPNTGEAVRHYLERQELSIDSIATEQDVTDIALNVLEMDEYGKHLIERIKTSRENGTEDEHAIRENQKLFNQIKVEIALISGVEIDVVNHTQQRDVYRGQIRDIVSSLDDGLSDEEIMTSLGIVQPVEGKHGFRFLFPSKIFPPFVQEQWSVYMDMVNQMEAAADKLRRGLISQVDFSGIDMMRKKAHDTVSQSIGDVLEFDGWEFEDYRQFVAKMRDKKYDEQMGELSRYAGDFVERFTGDEHLSIINKVIHKQG